MGRTDVGDLRWDRVVSENISTVNRSNWELSSLQNSVTDDEYAAQQEIYKMTAASSSKERKFE